MNNDLKRHNSTKLVVMPWWERGKNGFTSSRDSLPMPSVFRTSGQAVEGPWGAVRLIKHPLSLRVGWAAETLLMPGARRKRCRPAPPLTGGVGSPDQSEPGRVFPINEKPRASTVAVRQPPQAT